ncbi:hypothetical protein EW145_g1134 [Phellinidium pouzarii]|uniref:SNF7 family protein n=1 Tax=Phellinidium pouzarii TaxID=167371 RepID=A0A4S4LHE0_9AGAM|nr:hypothetical protein EW145_g1134 [Phellinidium pouzarii]
MGGGQILVFNAATDYRQVARLLRGAPPKRHRIEASDFDTIVHDGADVLTGRAQRARFTSLAALVSTTTLMALPTSKSNSRLSVIPTFSSLSTSRLKSIYSDLSRQKASNPASFHSNVDWWKRTLGAFVLLGLQSDSKNSLILHASPELSESLRYDGVGKPLGLAAVITELQDTRALIPLSDFLNSPISVYDTGSLAYKIASCVVGKPLWWALEQLSLVDSERVESETSIWRKVRGHYVVLANVEKVGDIVVERLRQKGSSSPADSLYSFDSFRKEFGGVIEGTSLSDVDLKVLVKFLDRDRKLIVSDNEAIKFIDSAESSSVPRLLTGVDKGILELKIGVENMEMQVEEINKQISDKTNKIGVCLRANRKEIAMTHLKSRKLYEDLLRKRLGSLEILQSTLIQVETAAQDVEIMKQYESSTATLRAILAHPSLQQEKIEETMDAMAEASAAQRELDETIRAGALPDDAIDEDALQAELADLVLESQQEEAEREELRALEDKHRVQGLDFKLPRAASSSDSDGALIDAEEKHSHALSSASPLSERKMHVHEQDMSW